MTTTYELITLNDVVKRELPGFEEYEDSYFEDWDLTMWRCEDGQPVEFLAQDGGEPEDNSFSRDGSWIAPALQTAYDRGFWDGWASGR